MCRTHKRSRDGRQLRSLGAAGPHARTVAASTAPAPSKGAVQKQPLGPSRNQNLCLPAAPRPPTRAKPARGKQPTDNSDSDMSAEENRDVGLKLLGPSKSKSLAFAVRNGKCTGIQSEPTPLPAQNRRGFLESLMDFLDTHGVEIDTSIEGVHGWEVPVSFGKEQIVPLYVYRESINDAASAQTKRCDLCSCMGWGSHPLSGDRYHFIVRKKRNGLVGDYAEHDDAQECEDSHEQNSNMGGSLRSSPGLCTHGRKRLRRVNHQSSDDSSTVQETPCCTARRPRACVVAAAAAAAASTTPGGTLHTRKPDVKALYNDSHVLHGLLHANGFGHLLRVNGRDGASNVLGGADVMDLWDRLCKTLCVRKVGVKDVARKDTMELRLVYTLAYGIPWYGKWGYTFARGSFGLTKNEYTKCVQKVRGTQLDSLKREFESRDLEVVAIIEHYTQLSTGAGLCGGKKIRNLGELLHLMLDLKRQAPRSSTPIDVFAVPNRVGGEKLVGGSCRAASSQPTGNAGHSKRKKAPQVTGRVVTRARSASAARLSPTQRVSKATSSVLGALKKYPKAWLSGRTSKENGLFDYVFRNIADVVAGKHMRGTGTKERAAKVESADRNDLRKATAKPDEARKGKGMSRTSDPSTSDSSVPEKRQPDTKESILQDLVYLYVHVLGNFGLYNDMAETANGSNPRASDSQAGTGKHLPGKQANGAKAGKRPTLDIFVNRILDGKLFVKEYTSEKVLLKGDATQTQRADGCLKGQGNRDHRILCALQFEKGDTRKAAQSPSELVQLPAQATFNDLRREAFLKFRRVYWTIRCMQNSNQLVNISTQPADHSEPEQRKLTEAKIGQRQIDGRRKLSSLIESESGEEKVMLFTVPHVVAGQCRTQVLFQSGREEWQVRCICGARDDDGEFDAYSP